MNKLIFASAAAALMLGVSAPAFAQATAADCQSLFQRADVNKDGSLQADEAKVFIEAMDKAQVKPQDVSMVKQEEFLAACQKNAFVNIDPATIGTASATGTATTEQAQTGTATTEQPATTTQTTDQAQTGTATTEQPAATTQTTDQAQTGTATTEQPATTTTEQPATTTTEQTAATQPTTTEQTTTTTSEQALAAPEGFLASNLIGATVYSQDDQSIGDINDIILSPQGQPSQVIVGVGGFLGLGEKDVVLDMSKLKIAALEDGKLKIVVETSSDELKNMPAFKKQ